MDYIIIRNSELQYYVTRLHSTTDNVPSVGRSVAATISDGLGSVLKFWERSGAGPSLSEKGTNQTQNTIRDIRLYKEISYFL